MLPVSKEVLIHEIEGSMKMLEKWRQKLDEGIPVVDLPAPEDRLEPFVRELCGELLIVAGKCEHLSSVVAGVL